MASRWFGLLLGVACMFGCATGTSQRRPDPPAPLPEIRSAPRATGMVWISGDWHWTGHDYEWIPGRWEAPPPTPPPAKPG